MRSAMKVGLYVCLLAALAGRAGSQARPPLSASTVQGQVRLPGGSPPAAVLHLRLEQNGQTLQEQISPDGAFRFENVAPGSYMLVIGSPGYAVAATPVDVPGSHFLQLELDLPAAAVPANPPVVSVADYQTPAAARRQFEQGEKKLRSGNCMAAVGHLRKAVAIFDGYAAAHNALGNCYGRLNQSDRAEQEFRRAIALTSSVYPALNLSDLYLQQGRTLEAETVLAAAIGRSPQEGDGYYALSLLRFAQNRLPEAEQLAGAAHAYPVHSPDAHLLLAKIYLREGRNDETLIRRQLELYLAEAQPGPLRDQIRRMLAGSKPKTN